MVVEFVDWQPTGNASTKIRLYPDTVPLLSSAMFNVHDVITTVVQGILWGEPEHIFVCKMYIMIGSWQCLCSYVSVDCL